jgi:hypothetical protein
MTFREDESRIRKKQGPLVFNVMRKIAITYLNNIQLSQRVWREKRKCQGLTMILAQPC